MMRAHNSTLAIGVNPFSYWVPERRLILESFRKRDERVTIDVVSNYTSRLISKLRKRLIDFAIVAQPFDYPDLEAMVIHASPLTLLVPAEDPLAQHQRVPLSALAGRSIPMSNPQLNAALSDILYGPLIAAGAKPVIVPEGEPAVPYFAVNERLPVVAVGWPHNLPGALADFVHVEFEPPAPMVRYALLRRNEPARGLLEHFWKNAARVMEGLSGDADAPPAQGGDERTPELATGR
jgi:DNA-binding transcriptional LysR family regulator